MAGAVNAARRPEFDEEADNGPVARILQQFGDTVIGTSREPGH